LPILKTLAEQLANIEWTAANIHALIEAAVTSNGLKFPKIAMPLRVIVTGGVQSPSIDAVMALMARARVLASLKAYFV
jgi:glutamyl-tRNA synthetase